MPNHMTGPNPIQLYLSEIGLQWLLPRAFLVKRYGVRPHAVYDWDVIEFETPRPFVKGLLWPLSAQVSPQFSPNEPATEFSGVLYVSDNAAENLRCTVDQLQPFLGEGTVLRSSNSIGHRWVYSLASVELHVWPPEMQQGPTLNPIYEKEPRLKAGCWIGITTGFRPWVSETEIAQLMAFEPVARIREEWLGPVPSFARSGLQYELEFIRPPDPGFDHCKGWIGCSADRTAFIFYGRELYFVPMEAVIQLQVERVLPAKGPGGSSLKVLCRCDYADQQTKTLTICSADGADDLDELATTVSRAIEKPLVLSPHVYDC